MLDDAIRIAGLPADTLILTLLLVGVATLSTVCVILWRGREKDKKMFIDHLRNESQQLANCSTAVRQELAPLRAGLKQIAQNLGIDLIDW